MSSNARRRKPWKEARQIIDVVATHEVDHVFRLFVRQIEELAQPRPLTLGRAHLRDDEVAQVAQDVARDMSGFFFARRGCPRPRGTLWHRPSIAPSQRSMEHRAVDNPQDLRDVFPPEESPLYAMT